MGVSVRSTAVGFTTSMIGDRAGSCLAGQNKKSMYTYSSSNSYTWDSSSDHDRKLSVGPMASARFSSSSSRARFRHSWWNVCIAAMWQSMVHGDGGGEADTERPREQRDDDAWVSVGVGIRWRCPGRPGPPSNHHPMSNSRMSRCIIATLHRFGSLLAHANFKDKAWTLRGDELIIAQ